MHSNLTSENLYAGDTAYKCYSTAEFVSTCKIPLAQVYKVPGGKGEQGAAAAALAYEDLIKGLSPDVLGVQHVILSSSLSLPPSLFPPHNPSLPPLCLSVCLSLALACLLAPCLPPYLPPSLPPSRSLPQQLTKIEKGMNDRTGLPALDLVLLGSGADGLVAASERPRRECARSVEREIESARERVREQEREGVRERAAPPQRCVSHSLVRGALCMGVVIIGHVPGSHCASLYPDSPQGDLKLFFVNIHIEIVSIHRNCSL